MSRPRRFGVEDITAKEREAWEAKHGEFWADTVEPETRTTIWDFDTEAAARAFLAGPVPSGYCARIFERTNIHRDEYGIWDWDTKELET